MMVDSLGRKVSSGMKNDLVNIQRAFSELYTHTHTQPFYCELYS